ncbi:hypothetical protein BT67DRAFT_55601 [Trichocladium antarcticum]|uniref:Uncharacterized protein n=1 Tax=Trichocladium antarcticum TaxID=1450529 RepID=A0AAN6ZCP7_9PEZI|nr:hypothetical protein BT67DRAFT_55601 [Trichocladium antarcticum]
MYVCQAQLTERGPSRASLVRVIPLSLAPAADRVRRVCTEYCRAFVTALYRRRAVAFGHSAAPTDRRWRGSEAGPGEPSPERTNASGVRSRAAAKYLHTPEPCSHSEGDDHGAWDPCTLSPCMRHPDAEKQGSRQAQHIARSAPSISRYRIVASSKYLTRGRRSAVMCQQPAGPPRFPRPVSPTRPGLVSSLFMSWSLPYPTGLFLSFFLARNKVCATRWSNRLANKPRHLAVTGRYPVVNNRRFRYPQAPSFCSNTPAMTKSQK